MEFLVLHVRTLIPSGKHIQKLLKMAIDFVDFPSYNMVIFNSYVKLPKSTRKH